MLKRVAVGVVVAGLVACGDASGPQGLDPIVLAENTQGIFRAVIVWWDQSGKREETVIPAFSTTCVKFVSTLATDSVRFLVVVGDTTGANGQPWAKQWSPWFNPKTGVTSDKAVYPDGAEYWTMTISDAPGAIMKTVKSAPC